MTQQSMVSDPRFDKPREQDGPPRDEYSEPYDVPPPRRSKWTTCLIGCLAVLGVMLLLVVIALVWINRHWRGWVADIGSQVINQGIDASDLPPQEKVEVKAQVERVTKAFGEGRISNEQAAAIIQKLTKSPLMPAIVVMAVEKNYFARSGLSDEEKAQGRQSLQRFARGVFDDKINQKGIDSVMAHVADRQTDQRWQLRRQVSDQDLRAALSEAKLRADEAGIPDAPEHIDPSDEVKRIIDEALDER